MDYFPLKKSEIIDYLNWREGPELRGGVRVKDKTRIENCSDYDKTDANYRLECRKYNAVFSHVIDFVDFNNSTMLWSFVNLTTPR